MPFYGQVEINRMTCKRTRLLWPIFMNAKVLMNLKYSYCFLQELVVPLEGTCGI